MIIISLTHLVYAYAGLHWKYWCRPKEAVQIRRLIAASTIQNYQRKERIEKELTHGCSCTLIRTLWLHTEIILSRWNGHRNCGKNQNGINYWISLLVRETSVRFEMLRISIYIQSKLKTPAMITPTSYFLSFSDSRNRNPESSTNPVI